MKQQFTLIGAILLMAFSVQAQERIVSGKVTSVEDGTPIPGVNIVLKSTMNGTTTDVDGAYKISVPSEGGTLIFSFIGFETQEINVGASTVIDVSMVLDVTELSEIVITGYGERQKRTYVGSISTLNSASIENRPVNTIDQVLQGQVPGLSLVASSGTPGSVQEIRIRGISSLTASNDPLFVIDGIPVITGSTERGSTGSLDALASINANDVESISVLKDATATALYGARGSNGVIIITTKKGKSGKPVISFNAQYGSVARATDAPEMLNAAQWDELYYEGRVNRGDAPDIATAKAMFNSGWDGVTSTKWSDEVLNKDARSQQYDIGIRGGGEQTNYYGSIAYFNQDGVNKGINLERYSGKINLSTYITDKVSFSNSITISRTEQNGQLEGSAYFGSPDAAYMFLRPTDAPYNPDGTINITNISGVIWNPLWFPEHNIREIIQGRVLGNSGLIVEILPGLEFSSTLGIDYFTTEEINYGNRYYGDGASGNGTSYMYNSRTSNWVWKNQLSYNFELGFSSKFGINLAYEAQKNNYKTIATGGFGFAADGLYYPSSAGTSDFSSGFVNDWSINSALVVLNYSFKDKIFFDGSFRREGNSRFHPDHRWGTFYAIGGSYVISEEGFLSGSNILTFAKIRASYGKTGNAGIGLNSYQSFLGFSGDYNGLPAVSPSSVGNAELTWENSNQFSVALQTSFLDRINLEVEYYNRLVYDMLFDVPLSRTTGFTSQTQNLGEMVNKGIELQADADIIRSGSFTWNLGLNFTTVDNEVTKLPRDANGMEIGIETGTYKITEGQPAYAYYMPTWAGVDPATGAPLWYTDETETATTSTLSLAGDAFQGMAPHATFFGALNTRVEFKGIYLTASLYYSTGNGVYDTWAFYTQSDGSQTFTIANGYASQYDRWQQPGDISPNPINIYRNTNQSNGLSSRRLYDGTYLRLRNVALGYNIPGNLVSKAKLSSARIYLMGNNFWTWKKDKQFEWDPEQGSNATINLVPSVLKTFTVGINITY